MNNPTTTNIPNKILLRVDEVAAIFGVCISTIYNWKNNGTLPCVKKIGNSIRFRREDIVNMLSEDE